MTRPLPKLVALCLLLLVVVQPRPHHAPPLPPVQPSSTPQVDWRPLQRAIDVKRWNDTIFYNSLAKQAEGNIGAQRRQQQAQEARYGTGACGGDLPPCSVMMCESGGSLTAQNPTSTASGKWQILDSTWAGYGGYARAADAPEEVQDARAREIYADGAGRRAWVC